MRVSSEMRVMFSTQNESQNIKKTEKTEKLSRVELIKAQIQNGEYKVDIEKTAKAMAKALLF
jgi:anti-sigma28 factor (negative regulator of flagellin synthesis)